MSKRDPYVALDIGRNWSERGAWPCRWIGLANPPAPPFLAAYRLNFSLGRAARVRLHVSADERYELFCDGVRLGRGPERGDAAHWYYETYAVALGAGKHCLVAQVWSLGNDAPYAQMSVRHGFILGAEGEFLPLLATGQAPWQGQRVAGCEFIRAGLTWGVGARQKIDGTAYPWGLEQGRGKAWGPVAILHHGVNGERKNEWPALHRLRPATLPPQLESCIASVAVRYIDTTSLDATQTTPVRVERAVKGEQAVWQALLDAGTWLVVPAHTCRRVLLDFETYQCAYTELEVSGGAGARIRCHWAEGLYEGSSGALSGGGEADARGKGNRDEIENKCFIGEGDLFLPDGGKKRRLAPLWWAAGRYVELAIETTEAPLTLLSLRFHETRYPLNMKGRISASDPRWKDVTGLAVRALQMCAHETYMDCPYYEQLQYLGDTRLQALATFVLTPDDRLPRKALQMGQASILSDRGLTQSRYPSRVAQVIPPFSLWWVAMLHDFALWRGDLPWLRTLMPGARLVLDTFLARLNPDGLLESPEGWNFTDWVPAWTQTTRDCRNWGVPPDGVSGISGVLNWHLVYTLIRAAELEEWLAEPQLAVRWRRAAMRLAAGLRAAFWKARRGLYADDLAHRHFSEHAQCLALLSGALPKSQARSLAQKLFHDSALERTTIYFAHYLFECAGLAGRIQPLFDRMEATWFPLRAMGLKTLPEEPEPCRSDCHAWGAHPLYHFYATVLGIRPATPGGAHLTIRPQLGPLEQAAGTLPHPRGAVTVSLENRRGRLRGRIALPRGVTATAHVNGRKQTLAEGSSEIH